jgi:uncharacterized protein YgiM (DUF1202 family)
MHFRINYFTSLIIILLSLISVGIAQDSGAVKFPYMAEITGDDVHMRAGRGTQYYSCGKLNKGDVVKVVAIQFTWSQIVPPKSAFSWISTKYVSVDSNNPSVGTVTGDRVRVYAGSADGNPIHSINWHFKLDSGEKVKLLGEENGGYYKIVPPAGAYLWVSSDFAKPIKRMEAKPLPDKKKPEPKIEEPKEEPKIEKTMVTKTVSPESRLNEYYELEKQIKAEQAKPIEQQDYTKIKRALAKIAKDKSEDKASRYADYTLKQMESFELALAANKAIRLQEKQLQRSQERIEKAYESRMANIQDLGKFAAIGILKKSVVYGKEPSVRHYRLIDENNKIVCYALPSGSAEKIDLSEFVGVKVGIVGKIEPHPETSSALVRFTQIEKIR